MKEAGKTKYGFHKLDHSLEMVEDEDDIEQDLTYKMMISKSTFFNQQI